VGAAENAPGAGLGFGIDIGGTGIKGAPVELSTGNFARERIRRTTPEPSTPQNVVAVVEELLTAFGWTGAFGCTVPGIVQHGVVHSAANIDPSWIGFDLEATLRERTGQPVAVVNDADAAGLAEVHYGAARDTSGTVLLTTLGTGIGSALVHHGVLVPNTELGHLYLTSGTVAERHAANSVREEEDLSWAEWAARLQAYFEHLEFLFSPDLLVIGGGVSKKANMFVPHLDLHTPVRPAELRNNAGVIGAATLGAALPG